LRCRQLLAAAVAMVGATAAGSAPVFHDSAFPRHLPPHLAPYGGEEAPPGEQPGGLEGRGGGGGGGSSGANGEPANPTASAPEPSASPSPPDEDEAFVCAPGLVMTWRLLEFKEPLDDRSATKEAAKTSLFHRLYGEAPALEEVCGTERTKNTNTIPKGCVSFKT
jgi:hypothetical protein